MSGEDQFPRRSFLQKSAVATFATGGLLGAAQTVSAEKNEKASTGSTSLSGHLGKIDEADKAHYYGPEQTEITYNGDRFAAITSVTTGPKTVHVEHENVGIGATYGIKFNEGAVDNSYLGDPVVKDLTIRFAGRGTPGNFQFANYRLNEADSGGPLDRGDIIKLIQYGIQALSQWGGLAVPLPPFASFIKNDNPDFNLDPSGWKSLEMYPEKKSGGGSVDFIPDADGGGAAPGYWNFKVEISGEVGWRGRAVGGPGYAKLGEFSHEHSPQIVLTHKPLMLVAGMNSKVDADELKELYDLYDHEKYLPGQDDPVSFDLVQEAASAYAADEIIKPSSAE